MRKLDLVTPLVLVLGAVFNGVLAARLPFVQQDDFLQAPGVGGGYRHKASSAGLVQIPGAQVTAGQLVALPGLEETGAGGETATSVVSSVAVETTSSIAIVTGSTTSAETKTSEVSSHSHLKLKTLTFYRPSCYLLQSQRCLLEVFKAFKLCLPSLLALGS
ncbi:hypothetical protein K445DRAFT_179318 [Daldinia sp. EC12]|nr:hypothetical protein K445DRAFT_179318 [Daldinia sp. EC12]